MKKFAKYTRSAALTFVMTAVTTVGIIPVSAGDNAAGKTVTYIDENGETRTAENCIVMADTEAVGDFSFEAGGWYVVNGSFTVNGRIENLAPADDPAHLILGFGGILRALHGIHNPAGKGLVVYTHDAMAVGMLEATCAVGSDGVSGNGDAGIGGNSGESGGNLTVNSGTVTAIGGIEGGTGIGGGSDCTDHGTTVVGDRLDIFAGNSEEDCRHMSLEVYLLMRECRRGFSYVKITGMPSYTVRHLKRKSDGTGYEEAETETLRGHTDDLTTAAFKVYNGFAPLPFEQQTIKRNGTTVVEIRYDRIPGHEHTFSEEWSHNELVHWHAATCGHDDAAAGFGAHTFIEGEKTETAIQYVCSECGCTKTGETGPGSKDDPWTVGDGVTAYIKDHILHLQGAGEVAEFADGAPWAEREKTLEGAYLPRTVDVPASVAETMPISIEDRFPSGEISGGEFERIEIVDGFARLAVGVYTNTDVTATIDDWGKTDIEDVTIDETGAAVLTVPANGEKGFFILKSKP